MGAPAGFENTLLRGAWSRDDGGKRVGVGGADRTVCIWDVESGQVQYKVNNNYDVLHKRKISDMFSSDSFLGTKARSLLSTSTLQNLSVSLFVLYITKVSLMQCRHAVLTGSKDATMLLGEIEPSVQV